jgi:hypothetical protein
MAIFSGAEAYVMAVIGVVLLATVVLAIYSMVQSQNNLKSIHNLQKATGGPPGQVTTVGAMQSVWPDTGLIDYVVSQGTLVGGQFLPINKPSAGTINTDNRYTADITIGTSRAPNVTNWMAARGGGAVSAIEADNIVSAFNGIIPQDLEEHVSFSARAGTVPILSLSVTNEFESAPSQEIVYFTILSAQKVSASTFRLTLQARVSVMPLAGKDGFSAGALTVSLLDPTTGAIPSSTMGIALAKQVIA